MWSLLTKTQWRDAIQQTGYTMSKRRTLTATTIRLVELDAAGVQVWRNRLGWFWARTEALKHAVASGAASPAAGPFGSATEAGDDAIAALSL